MLLRGENDELVEVLPMLQEIVDLKAYLRLGLDDEELAALRRHQRTDRPWGSHEFLKTLDRRFKRVLQPRKRGPKDPEIVNSMREEVMVTT